jgi:hypothetical protein
MVASFIKTIEKFLTVFFTEFSQHFWRQLNSHGDFIYLATTGAPKEFSWSSPLFSFSFRTFFFHEAGSGSDSLFLGKIGKSQLSVETPESLR